MTSSIARLLTRPTSETGATAVEYALMVTLIAMVIVAAVILMGNNLSAFFVDASTKI